MFGINAGVVPMWFALLIIPGIVLLLFSYPVHGATKKKHFLSIMTQFRDEVSSVLEFAQHYIEEGVDHIYIFNDNSTDGSIEALNCLDSQYYSVMNHSHTKKHYVTNPFKKFQFDIYQEMHDYFDLKGSTEWLIKADADEYISSRTHPHMSIRDILKYQSFRYDECAAISIPWLVYAWGNYTYTPHNQVRSSLLYRWGYDIKFAREIPDFGLTVSPTKFKNKHEGVENKIIYQTSKVTHGDRRIHTIDFGGGVAQTVCIPRLNGPMHCARNLTMERRKSLASVVQNPHTFKWLYVDSHRAPLKDIPDFCPFTNRFQSMQSPKFTFVAEEDIDHMQLLVFHYRIKSTDDLERKNKPGRFNRRGYSPKYMQVANRPDIFDDFLVSVRNPKRASHPDFIKAQQLFGTCPKKYYSSGCQKAKASC